MMMPRAAATPVVGEEDVGGVDDDGGVGEVGALGELEEEGDGVGADDQGALADGEHDEE